MKAKDKDQILSQASLFIARHEGLRLEAYKCPAGVWTIGYGDTDYLKQHQDLKSQTITQKKANELLANRLAEDYTFLSTILKITLTINQIVSLLSLMFNIGRTALNNSTLLHKLNNMRGSSLHEFTREELKDIEFEFMRWNRGGGKVLDGLTKRRHDEWRKFVE